MHDLLTADIRFWQLASAYVFILILIAIVRFRGIEREKDILISSVRMTIQLMLAGYVLAFIFNHTHPLYTLLIIGAMLGFAIFNIYQRSAWPLFPKLKKVIALSMSIGISVTLVYFMLVTLRVAPWYNPRYVIPISGMIIGNTMTGVALGVNTLLDGMTAKKQLVETALMLGATPKKAAGPIINQAFDAAMLPTINSMVGMGIIFLPGMMAGQIVGGSSPLLAIKYQIAVMLGITGGVSLTVLLFVQMGYRTFFNDRAQLRPQTARTGSNRADINSQF